ncbi:hypothetical protein HYH02_005485 [Chlamydomonas schloesseri]|uniref:Uncharacterized protein n=1 Tax=Chlamydomonas schloesseri TaxID=2026947 RepID=A0A836B6Z1_9CHLO|nr:hypothetical protein HYH02_005485 [Chlamydomonas schloesseri]|eukprot:KAG2449330.1 hypothetical protein HYH02_005485 [Chlamydomonas schloesseri]
MSDTQSGISLAPRAPLQIAPQVVVGIVDVAAVGARVLLSLQPPSGWTVAETGVDVVGLQQQQQQQQQQQPPAGAGEPGALRPVLTSAGAAEGLGTSGSSGSPAPPPAPLVVVRNMTPPGGSSPAVSLVVLNAAVPEGDQAEVAAALVDLTTATSGSGSSSSSSSSGSSSSSSSGSSIVVAAAMLLQQLSRPAPLYRHLLNGAKPPAGAAAEAAPPLPTSTTTSASAGAGAGAAAAAAAGGGLRVRDGQLAALLHVLAVGGEAAACLIVPGNKPTASAPPDLPDTAAACDTLGAALAGATGLSYSPAACRAVTASHKWFVPERTAGIDVMYT